MYRVELKGWSLIPCGLAVQVPNVPCGVESYGIFLLALLSSSKFLMYRVELKVWRLAFNVKHELSVPNVPCGVESIV